MTLASFLTIIDSPIFAMSSFSRPNKLICRRKNGSISPGRAASRHAELRGGALDFTSLDAFPSTARASSDGEGSGGRRHPGDRTMRVRTYPARETLSR